MNNSAKVWMIGRVDQAAILASHLAHQDRLARWDSFWRHDGTGFLPRPARRTDPVLNDVPGRHLLPDMLGKAAQCLRLPAPNLYSDIPLSLLARLNVPGAKILHGQGNYSLPAMRVAKRHGMITIADVTGQLAPIRAAQLADEYRDHGLTYREISNFLARRRVCEATSADAVFAPSDSVADGLLRSGIAENRIHLVPFAAPLCARLLTLPRPLRRDGITRVLYVGNLAIAKGVAHLLAAWRSLRQAFGPALELTLIGPARPCAKPYLDRLPDGCTWLGKLPQSKVIEHYLGSDIFLFPSLSEGCSLATLEAMAAGCAVMTTPDAGSPVTDRKTGWRIPPRNAPAIVKAVRTLHQAPDLCREIGRNARQEMRQSLQQGYGPRVEAAYEKVLSRHG